MNPNYTIKIYYIYMHMVKTTAYHNYVCQVYMSIRMLHADKQLYLDSRNFQC